MGMYLRTSSVPTNRHHLGRTYVRHGSSVVKLNLEVLRGVGDIQGHGDKVMRTWGADSRTWLKSNRSNSLYVTLDKVLEAQIKCTKSC